jgi:DNA repair exonuclease SbcCD ATPase subunit
MKWQDRRAVLFDIAGTLTDREVMAKDPKFSSLAKHLGEQTLSAYREKLLRKKKDFTGVREETPARLSECQRLLRDLEDLDFEAARAEEQTLLAQKQAIQAEILALVGSTAPEKKQLQLDQLLLQRQQLEAKNLAHRESQSGITQRADALNRERSALHKLQAALSAGEETVAALEEELDALRREWVTVNGEAFTDGKCPTCGQVLPFEQLRKATQTFNRRKEEKLTAIAAKLQNRRDALDREKVRLEQLSAEIAQAQQRVRELEQQLEKAEGSPVSDLSGYARELARLDKAMDKLRKEIHALKTASAGERQALEAKQKAAEDQLRFVREILAKQTLAEQTEARIAALRADAQAAEERLADIEKMLDTIQEFTRFKAKFVEESINSRFSLAAFRLFKEQANGGLEERCDAQVEGIPYPGLNNAMKVNVGIDIINTLSCHYGVRVPLFIDNAEAVTRLEESPAQVIRLVVSPGDRVLRTE